MNINIVKNKSTLQISPMGGVLGRVMQELQFNRVKPLYGKDAVLAKKRVEIENTQLYQYDAESDTLFTFAGLLDRVYRLLKSEGLTPALSEINPSKVFEPKFEYITGVDLREAQARMIATIASCDYAQLNGVTGMGKTMLITQICRMYPYEDCRIVVCAQQRPIVDALRRALEKYFPGQVGQVGGGRSTQKRITVSTAKSLRKIDASKVYMLIYDEVHTAAGKVISGFLSNFINSKMYGLSASTECRMDKADLLVEAIFGPVRVTVDMQEGQGEGYIPPVKAHFYEIYVPEVSKSTPTARKREAVWRNNARNYAVAAVAGYWEKQIPGAQILVMTDALEHVMFLKWYLKDYTMVYASSNKDQIARCRELGVLPDDFKALSNKGREEAIQSFECGQLRRVISTTTLGVGVDAPSLDVIIRADAGSTEISNIQFRGRVMRGEQGIYCDFMVQGDSNEEGRSKKRLASARNAGWPVVLEAVPYSETTDRWTKSPPRQ